MASIYSDAAREERYGRLRAKRNKLEKWRDRLMWAVILTSVIGMAVSISNGVLYGLFVNVGAFFGTILDFAQVALVIYAMYKRDYRITAGSLLVYPVLTAISVAVCGGSLNFGDLVMPLLLIELVIDIQWNKLSKEEGFPLFDISYAEREERKRVQDEIVRNRALNAGVRVAATGQTSDMGDLLDAGFDAPVLPPHLSARHDRSGKYAAPGTQKPEDFDAGKMDMLEEIGAPQKAPDEMDEL